MKKQTLLLALAFSVLAAPGIAQEISIDPGKWQYTVGGLMGPIPMNENGIDCVSEDEATADLSDLVSSIGECTISDAVRAGDKLTASLVCVSPLPMTADLNMTIAGNAAQVEVTGAMAIGGTTEFPVQLNATAERIGSCDS